MGHIGRSLMTKGTEAMDDHILIDTILEAQAIVARHIAGERISAEEAINELAKLLDSVELVKELAKRGYSSKAFE